MCLHLLEYYIELLVKDLATAAQIIAKYPPKDATLHMKCLWKIFIDDNEKKDEFNEYMEKEESDDDNEKEDDFDENEKKDDFDENKKKDDFDEYKEKDDFDEYEKNEEFDDLESKILYLLMKWNKKQPLELEAKRSLARKLIDYGQEIHLEMTEDDEFTNLVKKLDVHGKYFQIHAKCKCAFIVCLYCLSDHIKPKLSETGAN